MLVQWMHVGVMRALVVSGGGERVNKGFRDASGCVNPEPQTPNPKLKTLNPKP
jgi:hypothetical protein